jgi:predicted HicB family RNase H-like nuclease
MTELSIRIRPEVEERLREKAGQAGKTLEAFVEQLAVVESR